MFGNAHVERVYDFWSQHPRLFGVFASLAFGGREAEFRRRAIERLALAGDETVLDVGCGRGVDFPALSDRADRVVGVDYTAGMVAASRKVARRQTSGDVAVLRADAAALPLADESVDAAYAALSMTAIPDYEAAIEETYRVLRPGGRFVVFDTRPFQTFPQTLLNPLWGPLSAVATNWNPDADVLGALGETFDSASFRTFNAETVYLATGEKA